jgi:hypothetical protein
MSRGFLPFLGIYFWNYAGMSREGWVPCLTGQFTFRSRVSLFYFGLRVGNSPRLTQMLTTGQAPSPENQAGCGGNSTGKHTECAVHGLKFPFFGRFVFRMWKKPWFYLA